MLIKSCQAVSRHVVRNNMHMHYRYANTCWPTQVSRYFAGSASVKSDTGSTSNTGSTINSDVPGLSSKCLKVPNEPVGPGASKSAEYKNPEYFSYNNISYFEAEVEMFKYRLPQPSSTK